MTVRTSLAAVTLAGLCVLTMPARVGAQIEKGDKSFQLQGEYIQVVSPNSQDPSGTIVGQFGYYMTRNLGLKGTAGLIFEGSDVGYIVGAGGEWNFGAKGSTTVPYAKLDVLDFKVDMLNLLMLSPGGGVRFFLSRQTAFDVTASYNLAIASFQGGKADGGAIQVLLGFSYFFGGGDRR